VVMASDESGERRVWLAVGAASGPGGRRRGRRAAKAASGAGGEWLGRPVVGAASCGGFLVAGCFVEMDFGRRGGFERRWRSVGVGSVL